MVGERTLSTAFAPNGWWFQFLPLELLTTTKPTTKEFRYGASRRKSAKLTAAVEAFLNGITLLPFDPEAAERAGVLRTTMEAKGHGIAPADSQIAATAMAFGLSLVSKDGDLRRVPGLTGR